MFGRNRWRLGATLLWVVPLVLWHAQVVWGAGAADPGGSRRLAWDTARNRVSADLRDASLDAVLEEIATQTRWRVWVEPGMTGRVSTRFDGLPPGEALRRLLDRLNFTLIPQSNGPPHLYVFRTSMQDATRPLSAAADDLHAGGATNRIANEWIVRLKPGTDPEALARSVGAEIAGRIEELGAYRFRFADAAAAERARRSLEENAGVSAVEPNHALGQPAALQAVWSTSVGLPRVTPRSQDPNAPLVVAVVDTAVQPLPGTLNSFLLPPLQVAESAGPPPELPTHGTAMAQTILRGLEAAAGPNSSARLLPVDVFGGRETTSTFDLALGVYRAVQDGGARIVNLSLGGEADSPLLHELIRQVSDGGVLVVAAAGNQPTTAPVYPAAYPEVVAVTAGDRSGTIAPYANRGEFVDVVAPGASVVYYQGQPFLVAGTSAAAAFASGVAAGLVESRPAKPDEIINALKTVLGTPKQ
ncbi:MAG: hypothetical protein KatS3mg132_341 [Limisphaera sp.]|nr:MAG: hypothetical protein KatS3mg132_341 [Limisphaera sp.]